MKIEQFQKLIDELDGIDFSKFKDFISLFDKFNQLSKEVNEQFWKIQNATDKMKIELGEKHTELSNSISWQIKSFTWQFKSLSNKNEKQTQENIRKLETFQNQISKETKEQFWKMQNAYSVYKNEIDIETNQNKIENKEWQESTQKKLNNVIKIKWDKLTEDIDLFFDENTNNIQAIITDWNNKMDLRSNSFQKQKILLKIFIIISIISFVFWISAIVILYFNIQIWDIFSWI